MLELVYLNLFDFLARPNGSQPIVLPDDFSVAVAVTMAEADKAASEQIEKKATRGKRSPRASGLDGRSGNACRQLGPRESLNFREPRKRY